MGRLNLFVSVLLMLSAISLVTARYQARQLFIERPDPGCGPRTRHPLATAAA